MDADRFDAMTRSLESGSRRRMLTVLAGVALGAVAPLRGTIGVDAKKHGKNNNKDKKKKKHKSDCRPSGQFCTSGCGEGPCDSCCSGNCGFNYDRNDFVCCTEVGKACPSGCKANQQCDKCCGSGYCVSDGTCF
jgi:hypothetical protein